MQLRADLKKQGMKEAEIDILIKKEFGDIGASEESIASLEGSREDKDEMDVAGPAESHKNSSQ